jgi:hypothetical protein
MHIGGPKTGTTFIQQTLFENRKILNNFGIQAPFANRNHFQLALIGSEANARNRFYKWAETNAEDFQNFELSVRRRLYESSKMSDISYVTSEFLFQSVTSVDGVKRIASIIEGLFERVLVIAFVRRPEFLILPMYSTQVRSGRTEVINAEELSGKKVQTQSRKLSLWSNFFPANEFMTFPYLENEGGPQLFSRFFRCFNRSDASSEIRLLDARINQSLTRIGVEVLRKLNHRADKLTESERRKVIRLIESDATWDEKACLTKEQFLLAEEVSRVENVNLGKFMYDEDRLRFIEQTPSKFAEVSQDVVADIFAHKIDLCIARICSNTMIRSGG